MEIAKTSLNNLVIIESELFSDNRGSNFESYNLNALKEHGISLDFVQDALSHSKKDVLRGFHGDHKTWKLISCLLGDFFIVVADFNKESSQYLTTESLTLSQERAIQILVPPGLAIAHLALTDEIIFHYKQTTNYNRNSQFTYSWNDPRLNIDWPIKNPILSERDKPENIL